MTKWASYHLYTYKTWPFVIPLFLFQRKMDAGKWMWVDKKWIILEYQ